MTYADYIQSEAWKRRAQELKQLPGVVPAGECAICGVCRNLEVHHRTYQRLGREHPSDLIVLCDGCHQRVHGRTYDECADQLTLFADPLLNHG